MDNVNQTRNFNRIIVVLILLLLSLGVYTLVLWKESQTNLLELEDQKFTIIQELSDLKINYDELINNFQLQDEALNQARTRIEQLMKSLELTEPNMTMISRFRDEITRLKEERNILFARADSLINVTKRLSSEADSTQLILDRTRSVRDDLRQKNEALERMVEKGAQLQIIDFLGNAVIVRKNGRIVDTKRASRADKIRVCFTITPNLLAVSGEYNLYLQVINPKNNLMGMGGVLELKGKNLFYSSLSKINYKKKEIDLCLISEAQEKDLISGRYILNLYQDTTLLATNTMNLK